MKNTSKMSRSQTQTDQKNNSVVLAQSMRKSTTPKLPTLYVAPLQSQKITLNKPTPISTVQSKRESAMTLLKDLDIDIGTNDLPELAKNSSIAPFSGVGGISIIPTKTKEESEAEIRASDEKLRVHKLSQQFKSPRPSPHKVNPFAKQVRPQKVKSPPKPKVMSDDPRPPKVQIFQDVKGNVIGEKVIPRKYTYEQTQPDMQQVENTISSIAREDDIPEAYRTNSTPVVTSIAAGMSTFQLEEISKIYYNNIIAELDDMEPDRFKYVIEEHGIDDYIQSVLPYGSELDLATPQQKEIFQNVLVRRLKSAIGFKLSRINGTNPVKSVVKPVETKKEKPVFDNSHCPILDSDYLREHYDHTEHENRYMPLVEHCLKKRNQVDVANAILEYVHCPLGICRLIQSDDEKPQTYLYMYDERRPLWKKTNSKVMSNTTFNRFRSLLVNLKIHMEQNSDPSDEEDKQDITIKNIGLLIDDVSNTISMNGIWTQITMKIVHEVKWTPFHMHLRGNDEDTIREYNIFTGFQAIFVDDAIVDGKPHPDVQLFLDHIHNYIFNGKTDNYDHYMTCLYTSIVLMMKAECMYIFIGEPGCGKSTIFEILKKVFGKDLIYVAEEFSRVVGPFNGALRNKLMVCVDDANQAGTSFKRDNYNVLKSYTTASTITIEKKRIDQDPDCINNMTLMGATNFMFSMPIEKGQRRVIPIICIESLVGQFDYFVELYRRCNTQDFSNRFYSYLFSEHFQSRLVPLRLKPANENEQEIIEATMQPIDVFFKSVFNDGTVPINESMIYAKPNSDGSVSIYIHTGDFYTKFNEWFREYVGRNSKKTHGFSRSSFTTNIKRLSKKSIGTSIELKWPKRCKKESCCQLLGFFDNIELETASGDFITLSKKYKNICIS